ncbi:MAG: DUF4926 domain-containing protein [Cyanobacteria bacterium J06648_16]
MVELFDIVELLVTPSGYMLQPGTRGAVVDLHSNQTYEVEFTNAAGETIVQLALKPEQFVVVWRARTKSWVPLPERIAAVVACLPEETRIQVCDFARFIDNTERSAVPASSVS